MPNSSINVGFSEFIEDNVQELIQTMPWMKDTDMKMCESLEQLRAFIDRVIAKGDGKKKPHCCLDLETTGLNTRLRKGQPLEKIVGIALAIDKNTGIYIPINHKEGKEYNLPESFVLQEIRRLCECAIIIVHNAKFDLQFLKNFGITIDNFEDYEDTLILARLHDTGQKEIGLKYLSNKHLGRKMIELDEITKGSHRFDMVSPKLGYVYAASDSLCTYGLFDMYITHPIILEQMKTYFLEKRLVPVVMQMEQNLIVIDKEYLKAERIRITERLEQIKKTIHDAVGRDFNIGSTQQLGKILFEDPLHYEYPEKERTAKGFYKTDTAVLEKIEDRYPLVKQIVTFRKLEKSLGTYVENLLNNCDEDGCIKVGFSQNGTDTGRFSSPGGRGINEDGYCGVNVQSIPANYDADAPDVRKAFRARPGMKIVAMDFSGEELRVTANLSGEKKWIDEFLYGAADLHTTTGKAIFKKEEISKAERQIAKCVAKGTLIASEHGWVPIENLKKGDLVYTHKLKLAPVEKIWHMGKKPAITISTERIEITCGVNHRFLKSDIKNLSKPTTKDWLRAEDINVGQELMACFEEGIIGDASHRTPPEHYIEKVTEVKKCKDLVLMDLTVGKDHTYIAQGFITHNTCNFQILYGSGPRGIAEQAKISETEARRAVDGFLNGLPTLANWIKTERNKARRFKKATTPFGRIRPLDMFYNSGDKGQEAHADRCSVNFLVQGSCADIMKIVMVRVSNWIKSNNLQNEVKILLTMHDELVFEMPENKLSDYIPQLNDIMCLQDTLQGMLKWPVPLTVDAEYGDSWHVDHDFFKENPELKKMKASVAFHQSTQITEPEIPIAKNDIDPFFNVIMTEEQYQHAVRVGTLRDSESKRLGCQQSADCAGHDLRIDILGAAGELAYCLYTNQPWSESVNTFKAPDVGTNIQIRTTDNFDGKKSIEERTLIVREKDKDEDLYVLVLAEGRKFRVAGSMLGKDAKQSKYVRAPNGRAPAYFVPQEDLTAIERPKVEGVTEPESNADSKPAPIETPAETPVVSGEASFMELLSTVNVTDDAPLMTSVPESSVTPVSVSEDTLSELEEEIIFTIKDRSKVNLCRINQVITFLTETKDLPEFKGEIKILKIKDKDDFILTVSNLRVRNDAFYALAHFLGI